MRTARGHKAPDVSLGRCAAHEQGGFGVQVGFAFAVAVSDSGTVSGVVSLFVPEAPNQTLALARAFLACIQNPVVKHYGIHVSFFRMNERLCIGEGLHQTGRKTAFKTVPCSQCMPRRTRTCSSMHE